MESANPDLVSKCLELCQLVASQGQGFSLTVNVGSTFSFSLDSRKKDASMETQVSQPKIVELEETDAISKEEKSVEKRKVSEKEV